MNSDQYLNVITTVVTIASVIVSILPKPKATSRLNKVYKLLDILALNIIHKNTNK